MDQDEQDEDRPVGRFAEVRAVWRLLQAHPPMGDIVIGNTVAMVVTVVFAILGWPWFIPVAVWMIVGGLWMIWYTKRHPSEEE